MWTETRNVSWIIYFTWTYERLSELEVFLRKSISKKKIAFEQIVRDGKNGAKSDKRGPKNAPQGCELIIKHVHMYYKTFWTKPRTNCSREVRDIESGSWQRLEGWGSWRMTICKRLVPPDDHLQEARSSEWSFARGWILRMIICKQLVPPDDHLQKGGSSRGSFARGWIPWTIIKRLDPPN